MNIVRKFSLILFAGSILTNLLSGCVSSNNTNEGSTGPIELVYYKLFDDEDVFRPLIQQYQSQNPGVKITYRKFTDPIEYEELLINELAEGEGPDIFSVPNHWLLPNAKKVNPAPLEMVDPATFEATFVSVAYDDLVLRDPRDSFDKVFGIPLTVDTLALYYNKSHFEDKIPSRGRPATTWDELKEDVFTLTKKDNSFERFEVAGIAMGRADNILRATDILYMLMVQYGAEFYNENISEAQFTKQNVTLPNGESVNPVSEALNTYSGFALPSNKHYSWNQYLANARSATKEIETFAEGKVSMIFGYSYLYEDLLNVVQDLQDRGEQTIDVEDIRISTVPQVVDPDTSTEKRDAYANYYVETVSRTSEHPEQAWDFLIFLASKENLEYYNEKTKKPTSRRDMIEDQMQDPVYGVYAQQIGFAESLKIIDEVKFDSIFTEAIDSVLATVKISDVVKLAEEKINAMLPDEGFIPPPPIIEE